MPRKQTAILLILLFITAISFSACASKKKCSTKGKKRVEMGWM